LAPVPEQFGPNNQEKNSKLYTCPTIYLGGSGTQVSGSSFIIKKFLAPAPAIQNCSGIRIHGSAAYWVHSHQPELLDIFFVLNYPQKGTDQ